MLLLRPVSSLHICKFVLCFTSAACGRTGSSLLLVVCLHPLSSLVWAVLGSAWGCLGLLGHTGMLTPAVLRVLG